MKKFALLLCLLAFAVTDNVCAGENTKPGWPAEYKGVMLQGFWWESWDDTNWSSLTAKADELAPLFSLIWVPQSGKVDDGYRTMGYDVRYYFNQNSSFGTYAELRKMIQTYRDRGTGVVADVVVNHRNTTGSWYDFPVEQYNGITYRMYPSDICSNDEIATSWDGFATSGIKLGNADTGTNWSGMRDLDHTSDNVQKVIKAYLDFLRNDIGYAGFRYDMALGFGAGFVGKYNYSAQPDFSVGENWSDCNTIKNWMDDTRVDASGNWRSAAGQGDAQGFVVRSAAFDFPLKYKINEAFGGGNYSALLPDENATLTWNSYWRQYAVTFVDNHDTSRDVNACGHNQLAANAYILAMPGTPCVFYQHYLKWAQQMKLMIEARHLAGISNTSSFGTEVRNNCAKTNTKGSRGRVEVISGNGYGVFDPGAGGYVMITSGDNFAYYLSPDVNAPWADKPDGTYQGDLKVKLTAITTSTNKRITYNIDGGQESTVDNNATVTIPATLLTATHTLSMRLADSNETFTHTYTIQPKQDNITVYVRKDNGWTNRTFLYAWDESGDLNGAWPGEKMTETTMRGGSEFYYKTFNVSKLNFIINNSVGSQTQGIKDVVTDVYYTPNGIDLTSRIQERMKGDANADGSVSVADLTLVASYILGNRSTQINALAADMNGDGLITVADLAMLAARILGNAEL